MPGDQRGGPMQGQPISPVNEIETRVTGRRTVQYIIDAIIYGIVVSILGWALNRGHGGLHALLAIVWIVAVIAWYVLYWAWRPKTRNGQTFGMQIMGVRVISADGGPASLGQLDRPVHPAGAVQPDLPAGGHHHDVVLAVPAAGWRPSGQDHGGQGPGAADPGAAGVRGRGPGRLPLAPLLDCRRTRTAARRPGSCAPACNS